jgi:hypothetical protein
MNIQKILLSLTLIIPSIILSDDCCATNISQNLWQPHALSAYSSLNLIQMKDAYDKAAQGEEITDRLFYLSLAGQYMQSCGFNNLGILPFWSGTNTMTIGTNDGQSSLDAYQFGMGDVTTQGTITLNPKVQHFGVDATWYYMQHTTGRGAVVKINAPLGAMKITPTLCEEPAKLSDVADTIWTPPYPAVANRPQTLSAAFQGGAINGNTLQSQILHPITLYKGKIAGCCSQTMIRLADLSFLLGYNWLNDERGMCMIGAKVSCPTGNVPTGEYALEPIFGRAGHWGIGAEMSASYQIWNNDESQLRIWAEGEVIHLTSGRKPNFRSFDLKLNGAGSKYLLVQFYAAENPDLTATPANPTGRIPSFITQAANITTFPVISNIPVEGSLALMLDYQKDNWNIGLGGQVWGRSQESLSIDYCNALRYGMVNLNDYAVLGRQVSVNNATDTTLTYCQPLAKINQSVARQTTSSNAYPDQVKDARVSTNRIPQDITDALDICAAQAAHALTGQLFGEFGHTWRNELHTSNISVFGSAEFTNKNSSMINLWSVGLKGSVIF